MAADGLFPLVKAGSKGVRVKLSKERRRSSGTLSKFNRATVTEVSRAHVKGARASSAGLCFQIRHVQTSLDRDS